MRKRRLGDINPSFGKGTSDAEKQRPRGGTPALQASALELYCRIEYSKTINGLAWLWQRKT